MPDVQLTASQQDLLSAAREIMLPSPGRPRPEQAVALDGLLADLGVEGQDRGAFVREIHGQWRASGAPSKELRKVVRVWIEASESENLRPLRGAEYFNTHKDLAGGNVGLGFEAASALIAYADLVTDLSNRHMMSASQISRLLAARGDSRVVPWIAVHKLMVRLGLRTQLPADGIEKVLEADHLTEEAVFRDSRWDEAIQLVDGAAIRLGFRGDVALLLGLVAPNAESVHWPYVHMLHYALIPVGEFDHPPVFGYEFSPRGKEANEAFDPTYGDLSEATGNPILNNAKTIAWLGPWWSDSKWRSPGNASRTSADALVRVLEGIGELSPPASTELAALVRSWCLRQVRLFSPGSRPDVEPPDAHQVENLIRSIAIENTGTGGVLEQRLVDAIAAVGHDTTWRPRGLLDAVNAANLPRRKFGDCDFQHSTDRRVHAYEAHGGYLTRPYVDSHLATVARVLPNRVADDWGTKEGWSIEIRFVSHGFPSDLPTSAEVDGVPISIRYETFADLASQAVDDAVVAAVSRFVFEPLVDCRTPRAVLETYERMCE